MKRKFLKGFTLVELIVVMAVMSILMVAIMQMFKPIRETFVDSTTYEDQRTVQTGMAKYISESIRYSTDLGFYTKGFGAADPADAVSKFAQAYVAVNPSASVDDVKKNAEVIIIDRAKGYDWSANRTLKASTDKGGHGRILRRKFTGDEIKTDPTPTTLLTAAVSKEWRLALGTQYYGDKNDYTISFDITTSAADGIGVMVTSQVTQLSLRPKETDASGNKVPKPLAISNSATVLCPNLISGSVGKNSNAGVNEAGLFDTSKYFTGGGSPPSSDSTIYIVFLNEKI